MDEWGPTSGPIRHWTRILREVSRTPHLTGLDGFSGREPSPSRLDILYGVASPSGHTPKFGKKKAKHAWPIPKRLWHHPSPRLAHAKVGGGRDKALLGRNQAAGPREGHLLSRGPVPGWCTGYQSAQGLKSAQRDLAMCQVLPPAHPVRSSPLGTI
ncbi:hypothetical protein PGTUg99_011663 [Puccinia graminis f. sp. tritici]|uniref:Uncharacterized protein n=1 Tax=Puccinia graminis f. sp. tritici TaxID=56615 RepID=A0A5B0NJ56_PUCGR|nr:hypothetical protein PGTUg99_011663 [Puccinia graminis f. sp. tritici]